METPITDKIGIYNLLREYVVEIFSQTISEYGLKIVDDDSHSTITLLSEEKRFEISFSQVLFGGAAPHVKYIDLDNTNRINWYRLDLHLVALHNEDISADKPKYVYHFPNETLPRYQVKNALIFYNDLLRHYGKNILLGDKYDISDMLQKNKEVFVAIKK